MHKNTAVSLQNISKVYKLYDKPIDRLKESLHPLKKKYHKDFYALKNINLEIKKGEVLGIVGVNGAGKSTLLKIISGVLTPSSGRVNIHGRINAILELGSSLKPEMTGRENIKLNLQINGIETDREKITDEIIEFADIGEHIDQPIKSYSSGMKARLGFGIATSTDPDVLIVDEVLAVGDVLFQRKCYSRIEKLFKDGKTVIFVSHSAQSVVEFCSRAILLYDREIILDDTPKKV
ncbi:MAG: ABC transporter ATP-binding protein, partial [Bacteroidales bacterium]|nr:ABC transporter ATP-binding protein [Bacteroidales bacterium]